MTRFTRVRLRPRGPFHFGGRGVGLERSDVSLPADSLFSALCTAIAQRKGPEPVETLLNQFKAANTPATTPFRLTSLMPFAGEVALLPYPKIGPPEVSGATDLRTRKLFKAIEWVSQAVFNDLVQHKTPKDALEATEPITIQGSKVWVTAGEAQILSAFVPRDRSGGAKAQPVLWTTWQRPRVTVDRQTSASAVYSVGGTLFHRYGVEADETAGLYTVIEWLAADDETQCMMKTAFQDLGVEGIGGKRSNGYGQFDPAFDEIDAWDVGAGSGSYFVTLAPYHPRPVEQEVIGTGARYEITLRRGWLSLTGYTNVRRSSIRMIADGSVLRWPLDIEPLGDLTIVTPKLMSDANAPAIYRYGLAFPVRISDAAMPSLEDPPMKPCLAEEVQP